MHFLTLLVQIFLVTLLTFFASHFVATFVMLYVPVIYELFDAFLSNI